MGKSGEDIKKRSKPAAKASVSPVWISKSFLIRLPHVNILPPGDSNVNLESQRHTQTALLAASLAG